MAPAKGVNGNFSFGPGKINEEAFLTRFYRWVLHHAARSA
jgi:hypothetical protein